MASDSEAIETEITDYEAVYEAKRRWGTSAMTLFNGKDYYVGVGVSGDSWIRGYGKSWENAFADADRRRFS